jgi:hypothetical protein
MLRQIDAQRAQIGIENYGISVTTMEEVFLKVYPHPFLSSCSSTFPAHHLV